MQLGQLTTVLPGSRDECMIVNTHTDGSSAFEEDVSVAGVAMARRYASLHRESARRARARVRVLPRQPREGQLAGC